MKQRIVVRVSVYAVIQTRFLLASHSLPFRRRLRAVGIGALFFSVVSLGQAMEIIEASAEYSIDNYAEEEGVPSGEIYEIAQDPSGYLWLATKFGLVRFDGIDFEVWTPANLPALTDRMVHELTIGSDGTVWAATGVDFTAIKLNRVSTIRQADYHTTFAASDMVAYPGHLWVGGEHCLVHFRGATIVGAYSRADGLDHHSLTSIERTSDGSILVGTMLGLRRFLPETDRFTEDLGSRSFTGQPVDVITEDRHGRLWILPSLQPQGVHAHGIMVAGPGQPWQTFDAPDASNGGRRYGRFLVEDRRGDIWAAAGPGGLYRCDGRQIVRIQLPEVYADDFPLSACSDRDGDLWVGLESSGLLRLRRKLFRQFESSRGIPTTETESIHQSPDGSIWLGSSDGLFHWDGRSIEPVGVEGRAGIRDVRAIVEAPSDSVWIGAREGLFKLEGGQLRSAVDFGPNDPPKVRALTSAMDGSLWIGTIHGVYRWDGGTLDSWTETTGLPDKSVRTILQDRSGKVWVGTDNGLAVLDGNTWILLTSEDGLTSNFILDLLEDQRGRVWIATGDGLSVAVDLNVFGLEGSLNGPISQIVADNQNRIWLTSARGLHGVSADALFRTIRGEAELPAIWHFGHEDGLDSLQFAGEYSQSAGIQFADGKLAFATAKGIFEADLDRLVESMPPPEPVIGSVRAGGAIIYRNAPLKGHRLPIADLSRPSSFDPGGARVLEFELNAPSFAAPEKIRFSYRLIGLNDDWSEWGRNRRVYFADLEPGQYKFEVRTVGKSGRTSARTASFAFTIEPFFHQTASFYALVAAVVLVVAGGIHKWRINYVRRFDELERNNLLLQERTRIGHDLHDGLGSLLTRIHFSASILKEKRHSPDAIDRQLISLADSADEAGRTLRELIWLSDPKPIPFAELLAHLRHYAEDYLSESGISLRFKTQAPPAGEASGEVRQHVLFAMKEVLQNCARHSRASQVIISGEARPGSYRIKITDNGQGFSDARKDPNDGDSGHPAPGLGLTSLRDRLRRIGGGSEIRTKPGAGTTVILSIPTA